MDANNEAARLLLQGLTQEHPAMVANKKLRERESVEENKGFIAGVIGVGAGGGNTAHLLTSAEYATAALNTTQSDMKDINVHVKLAIKGIDGSGKDPNFSSSEFKRVGKEILAEKSLQQVLNNDIIFVIGTGGGGTGTVVSIMVAGFLKNEFPNKTIILVGLLGSIKEDRQEQRNMRAFLSNLETKAKVAGCPYMLFDNNRVKNKMGDDIYTEVNQEAANAIRLVAKEYFVENARSNIDGRDYARLTSFGGLMSVLTVPNLQVSVADDKVDLVSRVQAAIDKSSAIVTKDPEAYGFFVNTHPEVYSNIDTTFDDIQNHIGRPTAGLVFKHLQNSTSQGPEFGIIMTGMEAPVDRFTMIERRIQEYENVKEKATLPTVDRDGTQLRLAGDSKEAPNSGTGSSFLDLF